MRTIRQLSMPERLAALAGVAAAAASLLGFVPGLYRDRALVVAQSHGYDAGNLVVVLVLGVALAWSARGSLRGRLVAAGALVCLLYGYVTYAFLIVLNPATVLYIGVLGLGGWALATGLAGVDAEAVEAAVEGRLVRRTTGVVLVVLALVFAALWLSQIAQSVVTGRLPAGLTDAGWPMNPVYVLDLGFVVPLLLLTGSRLLRRRPGGARLAVALLTFVPLLAVSILAMAIGQAMAGQALQVPMVAAFVLVLALVGPLAWLALRSPARASARLRGRAPAS
jgi:hypothetical protein